MATERLDWEDPTSTSFSASVGDVTDEGIVLDRTAFYPTGGGQPHDTGEVSWDDRSARVTNVTQRGSIVHHLDGAFPPEGATVHGQIDWDRRWGHMRHHTAQHILSAVLLDEFDAETVGNQVYADRARLDCSHERFTSADLEQIERRVTEQIDADLSVSWGTLSRAEAEESLDPARTRLDRLPATVDPVRIVTIEALDRTACAGTHVSRTGDLGTFEITGRETGGRGRERIRFSLTE